MCEQGVLQFRLVVVAVEAGEDVADRSAIEAGSNGGLECRQKVGAVVVTQDVVHSLLSDVEVVHGGDVLLVDVAV
ncbi:hypothetical protein [Streptomyces sp. NPDC051561]|uniref:hypothetical protein n=1 Tax=Streptomyces sp. NPDC051561 TaxID=3365658 RepID=UPI0037BAB145